MQKMPQKRTAAKKQGISSSKKETVTNCEGIASGKLQHKVWQPGGRRKKNAATVAEQIMGSRQINIKHMIRRS